MSKMNTSNIDQIVGRNIRIHRLTKGWSQTALGGRIGVTFQQIQKYENGKNRVGSGRLFQIAALLDVPVTSFFEGGELTLRESGPSPVQLLAEPLCLRLVQAFSAISDRQTRRAVVVLVESIRRTNQRRTSAGGAARQ